MGSIQNLSDVTRTRGPFVLPCHTARVRGPPAERPQQSRPNERSSPCRCPAGFGWRGCYVAGEGLLKRLAIIVAAVMLAAPAQAQSVYELRVGMFQSDVERLVGAQIRQRVAERSSRSDCTWSAAGFRLYFCGRQLRVIQIDIGDDVRAFPDAGKACRDKADCIGQCILDFDQPDSVSRHPIGSEAAGQCQRDDALFGCYAVISGGRVTQPVCTD